MKIHLAGIDAGEYITSFKQGLEKAGIAVSSSQEAFLDRSITFGEIIHIHWPEAYFNNWQITKGSTFKKYVNALQYYQDRNPIVFSFHNALPHYGNRRAGYVIYHETIRHANVVHHLGPYTIDLIKQQYPFSKSKEHVVIPHHVLPKINANNSKTEARDLLGLEKDDFIAFAPGSLRNQSDLRSVIGSYEDLSTSSHKTLILHKYRHLLNRYACINMFKFPLASILEFYMRFLRSDIYCLNKLLPLEELCLYMIASDVIILERNKNINSGIPFLVCNFDTPIITHTSGNVLWSLENLGYQKSEKNKFIMKNKLKISKYNTSVFEEYKLLYLSYNFRNK